MANNGTWREERVTIRPNKSEVLYFPDTKPNYILVSNPSPSALYIGVNGVVNTSTYDMAIPPFGTRLYSRMNGSKSLYLFSNYNEEFKVTVSSWEDDFNPSSVAQSVEMVGAGADGLLGIVEINNILGSLPEGTNNIGTVGIKEFLAALPAGNNHIGLVTVDGGQIELVQDGAIYHHVTATTGNEVATIKNEKGYVYKIAITDGTDVQLFDGSTAAWKKGEFESDVPLICSDSIVLKFSTVGEAFILYK